MTIAITMCKLLLTLAVGFYLYKKEIFNQTVNRAMSAFIVRIAVPCIIINSVASVPHDDKSVVIKLLVVGILSYVLFIAMGYLLTTVVRVPKFLKGTYICMIVFGNAAFVGYPVVQALYGDAAIFYVSIFHMPFNLFIFTLAPYCFKKDASFVGNTQAAKKASLRDIFNNGLIASILAVIIYFGNISLPEGFYSVISFIGNITSPLSMICIGSSLAAISLKQMKNEKYIWFMIPIRLVVVPLVTWCFLHLFISDSVLIAICTISSGMSVAALVSMLSIENKRQHQSATIGVAVSTIFSMISIPIMAVLLL